MSTCLTRWLAVKYSFLNKKILNTVQIISLLLEREKRTEAKVKIHNVFLKTRFALMVEKLVLFTRKTKDNV